MASQNQTRLASLFASAPPSSHPSTWDSLWRTPTFLPWDRGSSSPALIDLLNIRDRPSTSPDPNPTPAAPPPNSSSLGYASLPPPRRKNGTRSRVLIPGCGRGYDVALFAAHGYDAYGLEVSAHAARAAREWLEDPGQGPLEGEYKVFDQEGREKKGDWGKMVVLEGDYFEESWVGGVEGWERDGGGFDVVLDYTFLCALPPELRSKWAKRTARLLREHDTKADPESDTRHDDGVLICIEFPTHKPANSGGPPWACPPTVHAELLKRPGEEITYDENGVVVATDRPEAENALVKIAHYTPRRTHTVGVIDGIVRDCVSMWRLKSHVSERERFHA
ncbi:S-adenosyl-L-methionine-dependent methyltransferase [Plenodomus tracheiphilus IPT5]|uniref:S-adenosyl-L-methionine-dependent methyltransferase n=1 Tax=Plenodomus tracheiphilus IPT5 TaxID=1408161 RepID=A0A6A7AT55_9PLEO|nr:S-adenosyl-L-methionine-dependent methyltransferase [Plenodomus tracheiphilus IPT5]